jgi:hypothetical protein
VARMWLHDVLCRCWWCELVPFAIFSMQLLMFVCLTTVSNFEQ